MRFALQLLLAFGFLGSLPARAVAAEPAPEGVSSREARQQAIRGVPFQRFSPTVGSEIREVLENPSYFRRMPTQQIDCDPQMFTFLVRRPEVMVNIWEIMGITKVTAQRTSPFTFVADDGVGTACKCDLVYSDGNMHIYLGNGTYDGTMAPRKVSGRCVCVLRTENRPGAAGDPNIAGTMDVFLKLDNFGADLLTRTIGPFVGKTADYNFVETARFITQISQICQMNPAAAQALVMRLDKIDDGTRREFAEIVTRIASTTADSHAHALPPSQGLELESQRVPAVAKEFSSHVDSPVELHLSSSDRWQAKVGEAADIGVQGGMDTRLPPPTAIMPLKPNIYMRR